MNRNTRITTSKRTQAVRVGLGALAATAALTALPAMASATTSCSFANNGVDDIVEVRMDGGPGRALFIQRAADGSIVVGAQGEGGRICTTASGFVRATLNNTDKIIVRRYTSDPNAQDTVVVDESQGRFRSDKGKQLSVVALTGTGGDVMRINGSIAGDRYTVLSSFLGGRGEIRLSTDSSIVSPGSFLMTAPGRIEIIGNDGNDTLGARIAAPADVSVPLTLIGGAGPDTLAGGSSGKDVFDGGTEDDSVFAANSIGGDKADGGLGKDNIFLNPGDIASGFESTALFGGSVGKLKLASRTVTATAAKPGVVSMSWTHPKAWKNLRDITVKAHDGAKQVGTVTIKPRSERITGSGALKLDQSDTSIAKQGKTVTVRLGLLATKALAGKTLRLDVHATDRNGKRQLEPGAAELRVAK